MRSAVLILTGALLLTTAPAPASGATGLRPPPRIELWTIGPGDDLYERFGHTALRVTEAQGEDRIYNYGTTDFSQPGLVTAFLTGDARFWLGVSSPARSRRVYQAKDRTIRATELRLPPAAARTLADLLAAEAADPALREYEYHHFRDNCTTRIRDRLDEVTDGALRAAVGRWPPGPTYRQLARAGFADLPLLLLLTDLVLGWPADRPNAPFALCFLPRIFQHGVEQAQVGWPDGSQAPLAGEPQLLYERQGPPPAGGNPRTPIRGTLVAAVVLIILALVLRRRGPVSRRMAGPVVTLVGLLTGAAGAVVWLLATVSVHPELRQNEILLWAWPSDLWLAVGGLLLLGRHPRLARVVRGYALVRIAVALALLAAMCGRLAVQPQWHLLALWLALWLLVHVLAGTRGLDDG